jgi:tetratricopeptide (TPR) repeat protein
LGRSCKNNGNIEEAITNYEQAVQIADETHRTDIKAKAYQLLEDVFCGIFEYKKAIEYYKKAREISPDIESDDLEVEAYQNVHNVEHADIEHKYENILDEERISLQRLLILGRSCQNNGKIEETIKNYEQAVQIADETHRNDIKAKAYQHLGNICTGTSEYKKAIEHYKQAGEISPDIEADDFEVEAYQRLGETVDNVQRVDIEHKYENILGEERISLERLLILGRSCQNNGKLKKP